MKLIHTSDWHLGRSLHGAALIDDQAHLLSQFVDLVRQERPDAVLIAGDVYDRAVPPTEAIALLDSVLFRLVVEIGVPVILIAGNHDSADRLAFCARLLDGRGLHIAAKLTAAPACVTLEDKHGPVSIYPLPFAEPTIVRGITARNDVQCHQSAMTALVECIAACRPKGRRCVAVAHCFVTGSKGCDSERPISVGGSTSVEASTFAGFDFVALGHLHRPQTCDSGKVWYSGSLMRYSFSETDHDKSVLVVEIDDGGGCEVRPIELTPRRQVRSIKGRFDEIMAHGRKDPARDDYVEVNLLDEGPIFDAMGKLRTVYPNILHIDREPLTGGSAGRAARVDHRKMDEMELFKAFFMEVTGQSLSDRQSAAVARAIDQVRVSEREAVA